MVSQIGSDQGTQFAVPSAPEAQEEVRMFPALRPKDDPWDLSESSFPPNGLAHLQPASGARVAYAGCVTEMQGDLLCGISIQIRTYLGTLLSRSCTKTGSI